MTDFTSLSAALAARGYGVRTFGSAREAAAYLTEAVRGCTVGIGGSMTAMEVGLDKTLPAVCQLTWHWLPAEGETVEMLLDRAATTEVYISSVNAIARTGEIVNIDGNCNRVASTMFGHRRVYLIIGRNKIAPTEEAAIARARHIAAPKNAARLNKSTPCVAAGRCMDCQSPDRICRGLTVLWCAPRGPEYEVLLIDEDLGY
jgi:L-lactate utilization protein LutB